MDSFGDSFQNMTADFDASDPSLEYCFRDVVLLVLVPQVYFTDPWIWDKPQQEHSTTFATLEYVRGTCSSWKDFIDGTAEWGALTVAQEEFCLLVPPIWTNKEEYVLLQFQKHPSLFSKIWWLQHPHFDDRWRTAPFGDLSAAKLQGLSLALEEDGHPCAEWEHSVLRPTPHLRITPNARVGA